MEKVKILKAVDIINDSVSEYEGDRPFLSTGDLNLSTITNLELHTFSEKPSRANQNVSSGDLILARMQGTVKVKLINNEDENIIVSTGFLVLRPKINADSKYLFHLLKSSNFQNDKDKLCTGATQKAINNSNFEKLEIPLPNLATQQRIAAILDQADAIIQNNRAILQKYDALTQSLFLDMFGDPVKNEKRFEKSTVGEQCNVKGGKRVPKNEKLVKENTGFPYIKAGNIKKGKVTTKDLEYLLPQTREKLKRYLVNEGDVCITVVGVNIGDIGIVPKELHKANLTENANKLLINDSKKLNNFYLAFYLQMDFVQQEIKKRTMAVGVPKLALFRIEQIELLLPPLELQNQFAERVAVIESQKQQAQLELAKSEELFNSLLQRAFNGELS